MSHHINVCEYGTVHGQCRCMSKDKTVRKIECPHPRSCAAKVASVQIAKHRKDVAPDSSPS